MRRILFNNIDYFGFEEKILQDFYIKNYPKYKNHFIFTTSGFLMEPNIVGDLSKQNRIVLVGRFGTYQQNNEMLFDMLQNNDCEFLKNRDIYLCGGMTQQFKQNLDIYKNNEKWAGKHIYEIGFLNHYELYGLLKTCKIFLHTARFEGDPNIQYDAMYGGCFLISTDVANIRQNYIKDYCSFFESENTQGLYNCLQGSINKVKSMTDKDFFNIQDYGLKNYQRKNTLSEILVKF